MTDMETYAQSSQYDWNIIHRVMMRWFCRVPDKMRYRIQSHIESSVRMSPYLSFPDIASGVGRQLSGDGRQVHEEILQAMTAFFLIKRIEDDWGDPKIPENITEITQEHYMVNDSIFTVKTFAEHHREREKIEMSPRDKASSFHRPGSGLLLHVASQTGAIRLGRNPADEVLLRSLRNLDRIPGTEYHAVGVLYVGPRQETEAQILANVYGSERYARFLKWIVLFSMNDARQCENTVACRDQVYGHRPYAKKSGKSQVEDSVARKEHEKFPQLTTAWENIPQDKIGKPIKSMPRLLGSPIPLDKHPGGLLPGKHGNYTYEYQDELSKITFLVATLMPNSENDPNCNMKKKLIGNNFVSVVFNESGAPFKLGSVCGQFAHVAIEVRCEAVAENDYSHTVVCQCMEECAR
ncbi:Rap/ran-GAP protein [Teladorsagia circumcincta]|uniref:Rap/ran-GAP protein n=1 Tax=Teladorsagia circumcincta TaxID=45464 RepID=A0A2G9UQ20_TELCI|nr:Rap/ran-GAP protein [Teladorsagia circumcincta]